MAILVLDGHSLGVAIIDESDWGFVSSLRGSGHRFYLYGGSKKLGRRYVGVASPSPRGLRVESYLQNLLLPDAEEVDHINRDTLDYRRENLRPCSHRENMLNQTRKSKSSNLPKGVYAYKEGYRATIRIVGGKRLAAFFKKLDDAHRWYNEMAQLHHGAFACVDPL